LFRAKAGGSSSSPTISDARPLTFLHVPATSGRGSGVHCRAAAGITGCKPCHAGPGGSDMVCRTSAGASRAGSGVPRLRIHSGLADRRGRALSSLKGAGLWREPATKSAARSRSEPLRVPASQSTARSRSVLSGSGPPLGRCMIYTRCAGRRNVGGHGTPFRGCTDLWKGVVSE